MHLATVGKSDGLAWLDPETYAVIARHPNVPYYTLFDACDCRTLDASVLAWSPEGRYLATTSAGGGVDIRDAEKRLRIVTLTGPVDPTKDSNWSGEEGPLLVRFSPDGQRLVALYTDHVAVYATELP
jgi:WD40 repeat protein